MSTTFDPPAEAEPPAETAIDPSVDTRAELIAAAARMLCEGGPGAISVRKVAAEVGTSTMAVYTHFGGKPELLRSVCIEGFRHLAARLGRVRPSADPVADLAGLARAYRRHALDDPHLFTVMFSRPVTDALTDPEDQMAALSTFLVLVDAVQRAIDAGRFTPQRADELALEMWSGVHGLVSIELGAGLQSTRQATRTLSALVRHLAIGAGDDRELAATSVPG
jgi:AcrR family transcriptional regulator